MTDELVENDAKALIEIKNLKLLSFKWAQIDSYVYTAFIILFTTLLRVIQKNVPFFRKNLPESCFMMLGGVIFELVRIQLNLGEEFEQHWPQLTNNTLFWIITPCCLINCSIQMFNRVFFNNIFSIVSLAVLGTLINIFFITLLLYYIQTLTNAYFPLQLTLHELILFASAISAVDPIGVLTIFDEIGIHRDIYYLLFGESVLNDAVVVTIFNILSEFKSIDHFELIEVVWVVISFFINSLGPFFIGSFYALLAILITKYTTFAIAAEPVVLILSAYLSYMTSETLRFSSIIAIVTNTMLIEQYAICNIARNSRISVKLIAETLATSSEGVKFYFLGTLLFRATHWYDLINQTMARLNFAFKLYPIRSTKFVLSTFIVCVVIRFLGNFFLFFISNSVFKRIRKVCIQEQFLISYCGLRSGIAYVLTSNIPDFHSNKQHIVTATLFNIFMTGLIMTPLVKVVINVLKVPVDNKLLTIKRNAPILVSINNRTTNFLAMAFEDLSGYYSMNSYVEKFHRYSEKHLVKYLLKTPTSISWRQIIDAYESSSKNAINKEGIRINWLQCTQKKKLNELETVIINQNNRQNLRSKINLYKSMMRRKISNKYTRQIQPDERFNGDGNHLDSRFNNLNSTHTQ